ncbi:DUF4846 domain-containing protein [Defluviitalea phaphyphila]|uniref:DUF4846 domain-containing protein n=1 Tax=Defluviitalea phaphyphila TaxID=1473580 RepID=UPI0007303294|nr:DUF4846 domain-containing protein [Defluviitalea phaphyphila]
MNYKVHIKLLIAAIIALLVLTSGCTQTELDSDKTEISENPNQEETVSSDEKEQVISKEIEEREERVILNLEGMVIQDRIPTPEGYERIDVKEDSFAYYLRNLPLKPHGEKVHYYNGKTKTANVYDAVIDMDIGERDLQQCADAVIRLRAEYLYSQERFDEIHFNFTNGFRADYKKWMEGYRIAIDGNNVSWVKRADNLNDYQSFRKYLDMVFSYAGTLSLSQEMVSVPIEEMKIGDVFIQGGSPGHCVIVVDMAENKETGEKLFLLAQSYMPAQDIHLLKNLQNEKISPWYSLNFGDVLKTPEWTFSKDDLKRFEGESSY